MAKDAMGCTHNRELRAGRTLLSQLCFRLCVRIINRRVQCGAGTVTAAVAAINKVILWHWMGQDVETFYSISVVEANRGAQHFIFCR